MLIREKTRSQFTARNGQFRQFYFMFIVADSANSILPPDGVEIFTFYTILLLISYQTIISSLHAVSWEKTNWYKWFAKCPHYLLITGMLKSNDLMQYCYVLNIYMNYHCYNYKYSRLVENHRTIAVDRLLKFTHF